ncbi:hypothetical protein FisN_2Lh186 [Fistulifera solaris]|uniref:Peptidase A1 domain-containing protein n=1 Tax=Fistulifera solaris TaxID=1519565 RepID=A0A1Z5KFP1_FISSO|nr:hypothetical protein FisN_2Lh186 [Fistulifera solaris]|eukprot:GAX24912.1 hypothetical protein FisN_2Lh186 [Fistulifera solaris]
MLYHYDTSLLLRLLLVLPLLEIHAVARENIRNATVRWALSAHTGTHHIQLWVGQPPVLQTLILDTGSRLSAWVCEPCLHCGQHQSARYYDPLQSSTSSVTLQVHGFSNSNTTTTTCQFPVSIREQSQCILQQHYTEGSRWTAYEVTDMVTLAGIVKDDDDDDDDDYEASLPYATVAFTFGCQTKLTGLFTKQLADGILGLEYSEFSFLSTLRDHGILPLEDSEADTSHDAFSLCLTKTGGWMALSGALLETHKTSMAHATLNRQTTKGMYSVIVQAIWVGTICLTCDETTDELIQAFATGRGTILDSGTTDTFLPQALADAFQEAWEEQTGRSFTEEERTASYTEREWKRLPVLTLVLEPGHVNITIPPEHYMERKEGETHNNIWSNRIYVDEPEGAVLGINAMMGHDILFDWKRGTVGIAPARC